MPITNLPVSHSAGQQSSGTVVNAVSAVQNNPAPAADPEKRKLIQKQLLLLLHADKCSRHENQSNGEMRQCTVPHCRTMKHVLIHMMSCLAGKSCPVPHCSSSRQILSHWKNCMKHDCLVCVPVKQVYDGQQQALNDQASLYSLQNLNPVSTQASQNSQLATTPLLQNSATGAIGNQSAQNFLLADNLEPEVQTENVALISATPTVPGTLPINPAVFKDWQKTITQELRHHLVQKIVQVIFPSTDITSLQDRRIINLVSYAQKIEGGMYSIANSREQYYQLLAERIYKIQMELEEKRQKRNELQMQHQQVGGPNLAPMLGNNAAETSTELPVTSAMSQLHLSSLAVPEQQMPSPNVTIQPNSELQEDSDPSAKSFIN